MGKAVLAELVRTDRHHHRRAAGDSGLTKAIKVLSRAHQNLIWTRQRQANQLRSTLRGYYSAAIELGELTGPDALGVLGAAPTPSLGQTLSRSRIRRPFAKPGANAGSTPERPKSRPCCARTSSPSRPSWPTPWASRLRPSSG